MLDATSPRPSLAVQKVKEFTESCRGLMPGQPEIEELKLIKIDVRWRRRGIKRLRKEEKETHTHARTHAHTHTHTHTNKQTPPTPPPQQQQQKQKRAISLAAVAADNTCCQARASFASIRLPPTQARWPKSGMLVNTRGVNHRAAPTTRYLGANKSRQTMGHTS